MYRWCGSIYVFMDVIDYMYKNYGICIYVDGSKLQINIIIFFVFHHITTHYQGKGNNLSFVLTFLTF